MASSSTVEPSAQQPTAWDFIANHPNLTRLAEFIRVANLVETYSRPDITVLVPTDEVLQAVVDRLGAEVFYDPVRSLPILQRHVLVGHLAEATLFDQPEPPRTVAGEELAVDGVTRTIDGARLVSADRVQANGAIVHVIDQVLLPESAT